MTSLILRTTGPLIATVIVLFSLILLFRGHNDPGGGFIAGLIAAMGSALLGMSRGVGEVRRLLRLDPIAVAGIGLLLSIFAGLFSALVGNPFLTGLWLPAYVFGTPSLFDIGVYLIVFGTVSAIVLVLEDSGEGT